MSGKPAAAADDEATDREYLETRARLREWRQSELARRMAPVPKSVGPKTPKKERPFQMADPPGIGSAGTQRKVGKG